MLKKILKICVWNFLFCFGFIPTIFCSSYNYNAFDTTHNSLKTNSFLKQIGGVVLRPDFFMHKHPVLALGLTSLLVYTGATYGLIKYYSGQPQNKNGKQSNNTNSQKTVFRKIYDMTIKNKIKALFCPLLFVYSFIYPQAQIWDDFASVLNNIPANEQIAKEKKIEKKKKIEEALERSKKLLEKTELESKERKEKEKKRELELQKEEEEFEQLKKSQKLGKKFDEEEAKKTESHIKELEDERKKQEEKIKKLEADDVSEEEEDIVEEKEVESEEEEEVCTVYTVKKNTTLKELSRIFSKCALEKLTIKYCNFINNEKLDWSKLKSLEELSVGKKININIKTLNTIFKNAQKLKKLDLSGHKFEEGNIEWSSLKNLEELDLSFSSITKVDLKKILEVCSNLKKLDLSFCKNLQEEIAKKYESSNDIKSLNEKLLNKDTKNKDTKVECLDASWTASTLNAKFKNIKTPIKLELCNNQKIDLENIEDIYLKKLIKIKFKASTISALTLLAIFTKCTNLERLDFENGTFEGQEYFKDIELGSFPPLYKLKKLLFGSTNINESLLKKILLLCPNLEKLNLSNCKEISKDHRMLFDTKEKIQNLKKALGIEKAN